MFTQIIGISSGGTNKFLLLSIFYFSHPMHLKKCKYPIFVIDYLNNFVNNQKKLVN